MRIIYICLGFSIYFLSATVSTAQISKENRDELFERMGQMCEKADAELTRFVKFEGDAGAKGVLKLVGAEISGSITVEQYENVEQKLDDFRTNPTICQFEAFKILLPIFQNSEDLSSNSPSGALERRASGSECRVVSGSSNECLSKYCLPGPHRDVGGSAMNFCVSAIKNCALPGGDGAMYGDQYRHGGVTLTCLNPSEYGYGRKWAQFFRP